ncbi:hypothetical protein JD969_10230 [Planctomycetota bacterium]|nr:hypothetical protein JD969_10230 [Planctomycetota bacterium]
MSKQYDIRPISSDFTLRATSNERWQPSHDIEKYIDGIWENEKDIRGDHLFNGELFGVIHADENEISGQWFEYRYYLAARKQPDLFLDNPLPIPAGVSGVLYHDDYVVFAKRSDKVMCYPNQLELAPSGAIDPSCFDKKTLLLDYRKLILKELEEEVAISADQIIQVIPYAIGRDHCDPSYEVCLQLKPIMSYGQMQNFVSTLTNQEYTEFHVIALNELQKYIDRNIEQIIPISQAMLQQLGLITLD